MTHHGRHHVCTNIMNHDMSELCRRRRVDPGWASSSRVSREGDATRTRSGAPAESRGTRRTSSLLASRRRLRCVCEPSFRAAATATATATGNATTTPRRTPTAANAKPAQHQHDHRVPAGRLGRRVVPVGERGERHGHPVELHLRQRRLQVLQRARGTADRRGLAHPDGRRQQPARLQGARGDELLLARARVPPRL